MNFVGFHFVLPAQVTINRKVTFGFGGRRELMFGRKLEFNLSNVIIYDKLDWYTVVDNSWNAGATGLAECASNIQHLRSDLAVFSVC